MPRRRTSIKTNRADKKKHLRNVTIKQEIKKSIKKFQALLSAKNIDEAKKLLHKLFSQLDKAAKKRVIHPRTSSRKKSRFMHKLLKSA